MSNLILPLSSLDSIAAQPLPRFSGALGLQPCLEPVPPSPRAPFPPEVAAASPASTVLVAEIVAPATVVHEISIPVTAVAEPLASATAVRCSVKACVFPVPADGRSECRYHRLLQSEAVLFQSHQPSHLLLLYAPLDVPEESEEEVDDSREQDRKRLAAEREKFILDDPSELV